MIQIVKIYIHEIALVVAEKGFDIPEKSIKHFTENENFEFVLVI